jgi:hypothetical protein
MEGGEALPVCFAISPDPQAPPPRAKGKHQLHGADDLISLFNLKPLWERSVKPYASNPRSKPKEQVDPSHDAASDIKPIVMEKTYVNYVRDLPGTLSVMA